MNRRIVLDIETSKDGTWCDSVCPFLDTEHARCNAVSSRLSSSVPRDVRVWLRHPACIEAERKAREAEDVVAAARHLVSAADACDREAERHPSSRSSAPMVRYVNAMARLREALAMGGE